MILVSFFLEDSVLSDEIKICYISEYQSYENRAIRFFWGVYMYASIRYWGVYASILGGGGGICQYPRES